jgi:pyridinium-3,5-biscarboxylic acid mononucleotide synthase
MDEHGIRLDLDRAARVGLDEAIYAAGKSAAQLDAIVAHAIGTRARRLFTRLDVASYEALSASHRDALDYDPISRTAILLSPGEREAPVATADPAVAVLTGGSSDLPVSSEVVRTLQYHGEACLHLPDVGVAGLWRLLEHVERLRRMRVLVVAAGMEGALPSVVGGLVPGLVIALPTSVGYGVSAGGRAALSSALASCAPGLVTVNIDNGYGAACAAVRALRGTAGP